jgi:hypothetical protein
VAEVTIFPTPLIWMGEYESLPEGGRFGWEVGWAFIGFGYFLSEHYKLNVAPIRKPITIVCPAWYQDGELRGTPFCIDSFPTKDPSSHWQVDVDLDSLVIGQKPRITVNPSIHLVDIWHG